ncbi:glycoside hydrolase family 27 protein [Oceanobacillus bengalensis]|uniref:Alpha-galactosidase n=1 Tax=Oceanobacillus bengalensis TaxID=1435466 RepID=A0A494YZL1_9BACI|nr:glycoside hydrolase family 27 protein [Oceanobacillus bengalensis]RKQ15681.1 glycoside hydrolase family 27 protein [Oceanobacillus bengalensis]
MKHHLLAPTPPMGWNSWDCYGATVTEEEVKGNAKYMAEFLKEYGWEYVVVDIQWYEAGAKSSTYRPFVPIEMDEYSRLVPAVNRFPSAKEGKGFKPLAEYVHNLGLKFGIHIMRGIPRQAVHQNTAILGTSIRAREIAKPNSICPWNTDMYGIDATKEGAQDYYNSLFQLYAEWGVDFVKVDDISDSKLYGIHTEEIKLIRKAMDHCERDMVLSLSPGPAPLEHASLLEENANMWRMTDDYWDLWPLLYDMFDRCNKWSKHVGLGHWPDADMLPLGHIGIRSVDGGASDRWTRFTKDEQITMMTLWSIFQSPLMFGGELRDNDEWTLSLLTNEEVLEVHRNSSCSRQVCRNEDKVVWAADDNNGNMYVALFNIGESRENINIALNEIDGNLTGKVQVRDIWREKQLEPVQDMLSFKLDPHASVLLKLSPIQVYTPKINL